MGDSVLKPGEVGFSEFTAALITQTLDAVISAQLGQEERARRLEELATMDLARFAEEAVKPDEADNELARLFPAEGFAHGVMPGAPYSPPRQGYAETPPVQQLTGYAVKPGDLSKTAEGTKIAEAGYRNILMHVRMALAEARRNIMLQMVRRGMPRVVVDHGKVNAKLTFQLSKETGTAQPKVAEAIKGVSPLLQIRTLPGLTVRPVEMWRPEVARLNINIVGEVEITFKTVSE